MKRNYLVGALVSALFLYLAFRKADLGEIRTAFAQARYGALVPVVALMLASLVLRAARWRYLLNPVKRIGFRSLFHATAIGLMANDLLPARIGEIVRAHVIGERERISRSASFATIVLERLLDGFTLLLFLAVILAAGVRMPGWLGKASIAAIVLYVVALACLVLFLARTPLVIGWGERLVRPLPRRPREVLLRTLHSFANGLAVLGSSRNLAAAALWSPFVWLPNAAMIHLLLVSFGIHLSVAVSFLLLVALCIGVMIPSAPGFIGTIQFVCVAVLGLFGVPRGQALSFSIVYHACIYVPVVAAGFACLAIEGMSFGEMRVAARRDASTGEPPEGGPRGS